MSILDWFVNLPPLGLEDNGIKMLLYVSALFVIILALVVYFVTRGEKKPRSGLSLEELDLDLSRPISNIAPEERIAVLNVEKSKFVAARRTLTDAYKKKELGDNVFERLSIRYAADLKKVEDEIEKTEKEAEVSQLEEELKKMQGDYLSKITGEKQVTTPAPSETPTTPPPGVTPPPTAGPPAVVSPPTVSPPGVTPPPTAGPPAVVSPPVGKPAPKPSIPTPTPVTTPTAGPPVVAAPAAAPTAASGEEGDLFAKSTSIAALRKEMLKELDRLKAFMSEQDK